MQMPIPLPLPLLKVISRSKSEVSEVVVSNLKMVVVVKKAVIGMKLTA
jgi:hypothetical protein